MVENDTVPVAFPDLFPVEERETHDAYGPERHLQDARDVLARVEGNVGGLEPELLAYIVDGCLVLAAENEVVVNAPSLQFDHDWCHLDQLCFGADEDVDHRKSAGKFDRFAGPQGRDGDARELNEPVF